jgi:hypothetical protein
LPTEKNPVCATSVDVSTMLKYLYVLISKLNIPVSSKYMSTASNFLKLVKPTVPPS